MVLIAGAAVLAVWWLESSRTTTVAYTVPGTLLGIELRVQSGDVTIVGGSRGCRLAVATTRSMGTDRVSSVSFGAGPCISSRRCPVLVLGSCASNYRIEVPNNVSITVRAEQGAVRLEGYQGSANLRTNAGSISVEGYCGLVLGATSASGSIRVGTSCSPSRLALFSASGSVAVTVPAGHYRINADSRSGRSRVSGLVSDAGAPWDIEALSNSGNVTVAANR